MSLTRRSLSTTAAAALLGGLLPARANAAQTLRVGIMSGQDEEIWETVTQQAKQRGLTLKTITFNDYTQPNEALEHGDLDANAFQHKPYLDNQIKVRGYHIVIVGYTAVWPIGLYSRRHRTLADLPKGAVIGVPNDPSNEGRALNVLAALNLITLREGAGILATTADIAANPRNITVRELDAGIVGRSINDLDAGIVNGDWAAKSGLTAADRLATESAVNNPYRNFIAVKAGHENDPWVKPLVASYQNDAVKAALAKAYRGTALAAW
jgi:D-methionine transport system substrate-binding protein